MFRVHVARLRVEGLEFRGQGPGLRVDGFRCRVFRRERAE